MCQAYEGEFNYICSIEQYAARAGYIAHLKGEPFLANPHNKWSKYEREAWDHGWGCREEGIVPYGIEADIRRTPGGGQDYSLKVTNDTADKHVCPGVQPLVAAGQKRDYRPSNGPDDPHFVDLESV